MKKKASSTLISLKVEDELLTKLDAYCDQTGISRTSAIERSVREMLRQFTISQSQDSLGYLKASGQWYEWTDYEGNWCLPGCAGSFGDRSKDTKDQTRSLQQLYAYYEKNWIETGDFKKVVTCKGTNGMAVIWTFSRLYIDRNGRVYDDIEPYLQKTVALLKRKCRDGQVLTDAGDDGASDYRIIWFIPEGNIRGLEYDHVLDAARTLEGLLENIRT